MVSGGYFLGRCRVIAPEISFVESSDGDYLFWIQFDTEDGFQDVMIEDPKMIKLLVEYRESLTKT